MEPASRDARRRRIADRGSDRLALITGRIPTIPSSTSDSAHSHTASCPPLLSQDFPHDLHPDPVITSHTDPFDDGYRHPLLRKCGTSTEAARVPTVREPTVREPTVREQPIVREPSVRESSNVVSSAVQSSSVSAASEREQQQPLQAQTRQPKILTPKELNFAIAASEKIRIHCSLAFAVLVILSYVGFPILGSSFIRGIIITRPLYLLLLTNTSIVVGLIFSVKQGKAKPETTSSSSNVAAVGDGGEQAMFEQVGNALELGFLLQKIMGAVFMDCSVYAIALVSGISLLQKLGC